MAGVSRKFWGDRHAERSDLTTYLFHLTRPANGGTTGTDAVDVLLKMLAARRIEASGTGFINGGAPVVCFQDAPPQSIAQNLWFELKYRKRMSDARVRYMGVGLAFEKGFVYARGGRPVIYDRSEAAKQYVQPQEWWRIVDFDLSDDDAIVDWTHEREWRMRGDLEFGYSDVQVLLNGEEAYRYFCRRCRAWNGDVLEQLAGILTIPALLW